MNNYMLVLISMILSAAATPLVKKLAVKIKAIDVPRDERRIHKKPIPRLGGLAIYISFIITIFLKEGMVKNSELGIIIGATIIVIGGILDDIKELKPKTKLIFQIAAAIILIINGVKIDILTNPFGGVDGMVDISWFGIPLTLLWVVGITNAINLIDGLDGLAAGVALISTITIFVVAVLNSRIEAALLTAILSGAILGFLPYNFNPASIFMGDTGAQLLGFLLASISIEGAIKSAAAFAISVPILAIGLPIYDTLFAMIRRKVNGKPISQGDRGHLHHRLLDLGLTQRQAVIVMYFISAILGGIAIIAMQISTVNSYFLMSSVIIIIVFIAWKAGFFKHK
ncbi:undecaprenyl/decaprenyl-phosphate alpha-N-acetylglucosaminyl 1-phosphate transferase [Clostridium swellfunianum]|uniref:glycosyltransferase family 4 protein n=1 Tax=Clostridium swellfunianum TaxID=1367462 RepID=UPI002030752F|nr:MraY family glycosyltransferase [Clostridium swellfunianum]MCM0649788.1 undecaprenyl/decaprenyl-phosphate alpha-N-acetylglucosaminyl 1-phosphate transferase [Clostridium swellfunianum]